MTTPTTPTATTAVGTRCHLVLRETPVGPLTLVAEDDCARRGLDGGPAPPPGRRGPRPSGPRSDPFLLLVADQLREYFAGERTAFDLPLAPQGTEFQRRV